MSYTAWVLLSSASTASAGLWTISIDESPAPPPDEGPPFSAHASRNLALLPYQIVGIVGAYVGSVLIVGSLLLTVGRRRRKRAQSMTIQAKEMVKPATKTFEPSPLSPNGSQRSWFSPKHLRAKKSTASSVRSGNSHHLSPGTTSVVSFDNSVIEADRARRQEEMERLWATVMTHQEQKDSQTSVTVQYGGPPPEYAGRQAPPRIVTDTPGLRHLQPPYSGTQSPSTPKSPVRAIYPPGSHLTGAPLPYSSSAQAEMPNHSFPQQSSPEHRRMREDRRPSFGSAQSPAPVSTPSKLRKSLRNIKISAPMARDDNSDGARTPLSPRFYVDPGVPPEPPTARPQETVNPTTLPAGRSFGHTDEELDEIRDLPQSNPQRLSAYNYANQAQLVTDVTSTRPDPTRSTGRAAGSGSLPLREMNRQYAQQQQASQAAFPLSPGHWNAPPSAGGTGYLTSAGPVKTTFLEARRDRLGGGMRTGQATPYSPYMPFTPLTPVTPRLTTRAERKQREKEERKAQGAITEEQQVANEKDLWSSGY